MKIGIIGAGNVGRALAAASVHAGHTVVIASAIEGEAESVISDVGKGATAAASNREAAAEAEVVILAVPFDAVSEITGEISSELGGKVLIDVTNRFSAHQLHGPSNAELIQEMARKVAPNAVVVKAFNTIFASHQADPLIDDIQLDGFVAGEDGTAKERVLDLVESLGFRPIDAGPLAMARALEGMGTLNISLNAANGWPWQSGWKLLGPTG